VEPLGLAVAILSPNSLFCGDFNTTPTSDVYALMTQKWTDIWNASGSGQRLHYSPFQFQIVALIYLDGVCRRAGCNERIRSLFTGIRPFSAATGEGEREIRRLCPREPRDVGRREFSRTRPCRGRTFRFVSPKVRSRFFPPSNQNPKTKRRKALSTHSIAARRF
jgi:hypothetical protein